MNRGDPITAFQRLRNLGQAGAARIKRDGLHILGEIGKKCVKIRYGTVNKSDLEVHHYSIKQGWIGIDSTVECVCCQLVNAGCG